MNHLEIEVKFSVHELVPVEIPLQELGARLLRPRHHELNLRFDTADGDLSRTHQVLRLRRSDDIRLTYKGPSNTRAGVVEREEIEFTVQDFDAARKFLEVLGFHVVMIYEKYRTAYQLQEAEILLDETPIGNFIEIEAPTPEAIAGTARRLGLDWESRIPTSYLALFERMRRKIGFSFRDLTFDNFSGILIPEDGLIGE